jgi:hypothetical protein
MENIKIRKFKMKKLEQMRLDPNIGPPCVVVIGKRNSGKCLGRGTRILKYDGTMINVESVKEGTLLLGPDSKSRKVVSVTQGRDLLYRINQEPYGKSYVVNSSHILTLMNLEGELVDIPIKQLLASKAVNDYRGVKSKMITFGKKGKESITISNTYRLGNKYNPKIPLCDEIRFSSLVHRRRFLYGYLDKCGKQNIGNTFTFVANSLSPDIIWLANSLGYHTTRKTITISEEYFTYPIQIEKFKFGDYFGFELEPVPDRRFLLEDFTITHNTYLVKDIMYTLRKIPTGVLMCKSSGGREAFAQVFPETNIYPDVDLKVVGNIMVSQNKLRETYGPDIRKVDYSAALIMDDCSAGPTIRNSKEIEEIIYNGRHARVMFIYSMHTVVNLNPGQRENVDFVFVCRTPSIETRRKLHKFFFSMVKFTDFCMMMDRLTENYGCLVFDNTARGNSPSDCIFYYRARSPAPDFKFGSKEIWKILTDQKKAERESRNGKKIIKKANPRGPESKSKSIKF